MQEHDVLIVGAGPVGLALALALSDDGLDVALVDARDRPAVTADPRILALAHGSRLTLERLGVWTPLNVTPIETIHVSQESGFGRTLMRAETLGVPALGYVTSAGELAGVMRTAVERTGVQILDATEALDFDPDQEGVTVTLRAKGNPDAGVRRHARLVVRAEGGPGKGEDVSERDYGQHALISTVSTREGHRHIAFERFTCEGPVALLPFRDEYAVVHVLSADTSEQMLGLDDAAYLERLQTHLGRRVSLTAASRRIRYPLGLRYRRQPVESHTVWIGNAAQTLHPVAGQGFNLALRDVWALAEILLAHRETPGDQALLDTYAHGRRLDRFGTINFTDGLIRLFSNEFAPLRQLRGMGLFALDACPPLRNFVARRMMFGARAWP